MADRNPDAGVTWLHSCFTDDKRKSYCVYDGPDPEAIGRTAERNGLPVERITEVSVLNLYLFGWTWFPRRATLGWTGPARLGVGAASAPGNTEPPPSPSPDAFLGFLFATRDIPS